MAVLVLELPTIPFAETLNKHNIPIPAGWPIPASIWFLLPASDRPWMWWTQMATVS